MVGGGVTGLRSAGLASRRQWFAVLFFHLLDRKNPASKVLDLRQFLLNGLQPFMPLAMSDLGLGVVSASKPVFLIQAMKLSDLVAETSNLIPKNFQMIHVYRIPYFALRSYFAGTQ
jgi:hypothetical protein